MNKANKVGHGLHLLSRYDQKNSICAEHGIIYSGHEVKPEQLDDNDRAFMKAWGWTHDESIPAWTRSV